jgi:hypothetical protein
MMFKDEGGKMGIRKWQEENELGRERNGGQEIATEV